MDTANPSIPSHSAPDFQALFESAPGLYLVLTMDFTIVAVSENYLRATMTRREDILGRGIFEVFPDNPDDPSATGTRNLRTSLESVLKNKTPNAMAVQKYDIRKPESEGGEFEERYWSPLNSPVLGSDGEVAYIIHRAEDVTEFVYLKQKGLELDKAAKEMETEIYLRAQEVQEANRQLAEAKQQVENYAKRLEDKVLVSEEKHRLLMEHARDSIFVLDDEGAIVDANHAAEGLFGLPRGEMINRRFDAFLMILATGDMAEPFPDISGLISAESFRVENVCLKQGKGKRIHVNISSSRVQMSKTFLIFCIVYDVTERINLEQELRQAQKMEAIGNLTGGMAHDFNNLLGVVIGNLDLLLEHAGEGSLTKQLTQEALAGALRGADLTNRLLAFARQQPLQPQRVDVNRLVSEITKLMRRTLGENVAISLELFGPLWPVVVDPAQLEASLINLANNARDAMPKGGRLIISTNNRHLDEEYASTHSDVKSGDYAVVEITDTGTGMPPEVANRIFEPFFTTKERGKGTGLGLSMVFGFMKQSNGHINVYSEPGVGTTFRLYLPRALAGSAAANDGSLSPSVLRGRERVLVVEDNHAMRLIVTRQLSELGYRVLEAVNGPDALKLIDKEEVDLLFTDVVMPGGMDGIELARQALVRRPGLKVVLTSGFPETKLTGGKLLQPQSLRLLSKPYRKQDLARILREVLGDKPVS